jgi:hypothetical protein
MRTNQTEEELLLYISQLEDEVAKLREALLYVQNKIYLDEHDFWSLDIDFELIKIHEALWGQ